jgi:hypothetical protein
MSCTQVSIFRRLLFVIVYCLTLPLLILGVFLLILIGLYQILSWLFTGCADEDALFKPLEFIVNLPYKIIE